MNIFEFEDYRKFIILKVKSQPKNGRGEYQRIAKSLRIHTTYLSQIIKGLKNLNQDQALELAEYWKMNPAESRYFILLVDYERAASQKLKDYIRSQIFQLREESKKLVNRLHSEKTLDEKNQVHFYSNWHYSAIRLATSIPHLKNRSALTQYFHISHEELERILSFLIATGLCEQQGEKVVMGVQRTHLPASSPLISKHHINWRLRAFENYNQLKKEDLSFSGPLTISAKDADAVREKLTQMIREISDLVKETNPEQLRCLNIDWFGF